MQALGENGKFFMQEPHTGRPQTEQGLAEVFA
jgi:hypothetical protein